MEPQVAEKKSLGPIIGIIVIIAVLVVGAFYIWGGKIAGTPTPTEGFESIETDLDSAVDIQIDLSDLEAELQ